MTKTTLTRYMPVKKDGSLLPHRVLKIHPDFFTLDHENQCQINHTQTLDKIAERGGLTVVELLAVLLGVKWDYVKHIEIRAAHLIIQGMIDAYSFGLQNSEKPLTNVQPDWVKLPLILQKQAEHLLTQSQDKNQDAGSRMVSSNVALTITCLASALDKVINPDDNQSS